MNDDILSKNFRTLSRYSAKKCSRNTSGIIGVTKYNNVWKAQIYYKGKTYWLGTFYDIKSAENARLKAETIVRNKLLEEIEIDRLLKSASANK